jgi:hypothetical protein
MITKYSQQGDILIKRISALPEGAKLVPSKYGSALVLQHGETTNHKHQFAPINGKPQRVELYVDPAFAGQEASITPDEGKFIIVSAADGQEYALLTHEEHKPVIVEPGIYQISIVREFDYDKMEARRVVD